MITTNGQNMMTSHVKQVKQFLSLAHRPFHYFATNGLLFGMNIKSFSDWIWKAFYLDGRPARDEVALSLRKCLEYLAETSPGNCVEFFQVSEWFTHSVYIIQCARKYSIDISNIIENEKQYDKEKASDWSNSPFLKKPILSSNLYSYIDLDEAEVSISAAEEELSKVCINSVNVDMVEKSIKTAERLLFNNESMFNVDLNEVNLSLTSLYKAFTNNNTEGKEEMLNDTENKIYTTERIEEMLNDTENKISETKLKIEKEINMLRSQEVIHSIGDLAAQYRLKFPTKQHQPITRSEIVREVIQEKSPPSTNPNPTLQLQVQKQTKYSGKCRMSNETRDIKKKRFFKTESSIQETRFYLQRLVLHSEYCNDKMKSILQSFDKNNLGVVSYKIFRDILTKELQLNVHQVHSCFHIFDPTYTGLIKYRKFLKVMNSNTKFDSPYMKYPKESYTKIYTKTKANRKRMYGI